MPDSRIKKLLCTVFAVFPALFFCLSAFSSNPAPENWVGVTKDLIKRANRVVSLVDESAQMAPEAANAQPPRVGDQRKFYAVDFARSGSPYSTDATCRAVGKFCYIFVEDTQWQNGSVTYSSIISLKRAFDSSTPSNPTRGIYALETGELGPAPDEIDHDPRIYIFVLDIPDNYVQSANYVAGYVDPINEKKGVVWDPDTGMKLHSNEVEMVYIDCDPMDVGSAVSKQILAHEFQHLIHWRQDPDEDTWVNEGCSDYAAMMLCGYNDDLAFHIRAFEEEPNTSLVYWPAGMMSSMASYGAAYLWMVYLHEHYGGVSTISALIAEPDNGIKGINDVLAAKGYSQDFHHIFSDWKVANLIDDMAFSDGRYGYKSVDLHMRYQKRHSHFPVSSITYIRSWATQYVKFAGGDGISDLQVDFAARDFADMFGVAAILMEGGRPLSIEFAENQANPDKGHISIRDFGGTADSVILVPSWEPESEADFGSAADFLYSARLGEKLRFKAAVLPNAVRTCYMDFVVQFNSSTDGESPRISLSNRGKVIVDKKTMDPLMPTDDQGRAAYVYQVYIPREWDTFQVEWDVYYSGRWLGGGDVGTLMGKKKQKKP